MRSLRCLVVLGGAALVLSLGGCSSSRHTSTVVLVDHPVPVVTKGGPPPYAPAHGYRAHHRDGVDLVYDSGLGVYTVVGHSGCYYQSNRFYRKHAGRWEMANSTRGPWRVTTTATVPGGLVAERNKNERAEKGHGKHW
jgi:hypothetical protein